jgi:hypothetical protein
MQTDLNSRVRESASQQHVQQATENVHNALMARELNMVALSVHSTERDLVKKGHTADLSVRSMEKGLSMARDHNTVRDHNTARDHNTEDHSVHNTASVRSMEKDHSTVSHSVHSMASRLTVSHMASHKEDLDMTHRQNIP